MESETVEEMQDIEVLDEDGKASNPQASKLFKAAQKAIESGAEAVEKVGTQVVARSEEFFRNKKLMKMQMLFYGVIHLYNDGLEEFMNV